MYKSPLKIFKSYHLFSKKTTRVNLYKQKTETHLKLCMIHLLQSDCDVYDHFHASLT